jgi:hypothetical protein
VDFIISKDNKDKIQFIASVKDDGCLKCTGTGVNEERWASNENM